MGRIKTQLIKRSAKIFINKHSEVVKDNFDENKKVVEENTDISSKKLRNILAGYITRLKKKNSLMFSK